MRKPHRGQINAYSNSVLSSFSPRKSVERDDLDRLAGVGSQYRTRGKSPRTTRGSATGDARGSSKSPSRVRPSERPRTHRIPRAPANVKVLQSKRHADCADPHCTFSPAVNAGSSLMEHSRNVSVFDSLHEGSEKKRAARADLETKHVAQQMKKCPFTPQINSGPAKTAVVPPGVEHQIEEWKEKGRKRRDAGEHLEPKKETASTGPTDKQFAPRVNKSYMGARSNTAWEDDATIRHTVARMRGDHLPAVSNGSEPPSKRPPPTRYHSSPRLLGATGRTASEVSTKRPVLYNSRALRLGDSNGSGSDSEIPDSRSDDGAHPWRRSSVSTTGPVGINVSTQTTSGHGAGREDGGDARQLSDEIDRLKQEARAREALLAAGEEEMASLSSDVDLLKEENYALRMLLNNAEGGDHRGALEQLAEEQANDNSAEVAELKKQLARAKDDGEEVAELKRQLAEERANDNSGEMEQLRQRLKDTSEELEELKRQLAEERAQNGAEDTGTDAPDNIESTAGDGAPSLEDKKHLQRYRALVQKAAENSSVVVQKATTAHGDKVAMRMVFTQANQLLDQLVGSLHHLANGTDDAEKRKQIMGLDYNIDHMREHLQREQALLLKEPTNKVGIERLKATLMQIQDIRDIALADTIDVVVRPELREAIQAVAMFRGVENAGFFNHLIRKLKHVQYAPDEAIVRYGEKGESMFFLTKGNVNVLDKDKQLIVTLHTGAFFGEVAVFTEGHRMASVIASSSGYVDVYELDRKVLVETLRSYPEYIETFEDVARARLYQSNHHDARQKMVQAADEVERVRAHVQREDLYGKVQSGHRVDDVAPIMREVLEELAAVCSSVIVHEKIQEARAAVDAVKSKADLRGGLEAVVAALGLADLACFIPNTEMFQGTPQSFVDDLLRAARIVTHEPNKSLLNHEAHTVHQAMAYADDELSLSYVLRGAVVLIIKEGSAISGHLDRGFTFGHYAFDPKLSLAANVNSGEVAMEVGVITHEGLDQALANCPAARDLVQAYQNREHELTLLSNAIGVELFSS